MTSAVAERRHASRRHHVRASATHMRMRKGRHDEHRLCTKGAENEAVSAGSSRQNKIHSPTGHSMTVNVWLEGKCYLSRL